jgi:hypothetical protein
MSARDSTVYKHVTKHCPISKEHRGGCEHQVENPCSGGIYQHFPGWAEENPERHFRIGEFLAKILTRNLLIMKQECQPLDSDIIRTMLHITLYPGSSGVDTDPVCTTSWTCLIEALVGSRLTRWIRRESRYALVLSYACSLPGEWPPL